MDFVDLVFYLLLALLDVRLESPIIVGLMLGGVTVWVVLLIDSFNISLPTVCFVRFFFLIDMLIILDCTHTRGLLKLLNDLVIRG